jgi:hypothetical protein
MVSFVIDKSRWSAMLSRSTNAKVLNAATASSRPSPASAVANGSPSFSRASENKNSGIGSGASIAA